MARSKKQKVLDYDGEDIISNLHDNILSQILSFLPTQEAARTSLLSKRWRYVWIYITSLEFHDESQYKGVDPKTEKQKFLQLVNRILQQQISTSSILSFTLGLSYSYPSDNLNALICRVLEQKVQKLSVKHINRVPVFPCAVFNSRSLIELDINMPTGLACPSSNCLTSLRVLKLRYFEFFRNCSSSSKELMLGFPVLQVLEMDNCALLDVNGLVIHTPMLESLSIIYPKFMKRLANKDLRVSGTIKLFALRLRKFFYYGDLKEAIILSNPSTVIDAFINVQLSNFQDEEVPKTGLGACLILKELHESVKFLELGPYMISTLARLKDDSLQRLPIFETLVSVELAFWDFHPFDDILLKLLQKSPNLQILKLNIDKSKFGTTILSSMEVPRCIQRKLKVLIIRLSIWDEDKLQFAKYVLENAQMLDQLTISLKAGVRKVKEELPSMPKASTSTRIEVKRTTSKELKELYDKYTFWLN